MSDTKKIPSPVEDGDSVDPYEDSTLSTKEPYRPDQWVEYVNLEAVLMDFEMMLQSDLWAEANAEGELPSALYDWLQRIRSSSPAAPASQPNESVPNVSAQSREYQEAAQREDELLGIKSRHSRILALMNWKITDAGEGTK